MTHVIARVLRLDGGQLAAVLQTLPPSAIQANTSRSCAPVNQTLI